MTAGSQDRVPRLMLVTDRKRTRGRDLIPLVSQAVAGGVGIVQIREPDLSVTQFDELVRKIRRALPPRFPLVVNGRLDVAMKLRTGLHLAAARRLRDEDFAAEPSWFPLYGRSAHDTREADVAIEEGASYLVLGTIYPTPSKPGHPGSGPVLLERVLPRVGRLPVLAIGGVAVSNIAELMHAGAHGVAVCGAILGANDPCRVAQAMTLALNVATRAIGAAGRAPRPRSEAE